MFPLTASQEIVWLHEQIMPGSRVYNFTASLDLRGALDPTALSDGLASVLARHPGLRLELVDREGDMPAQRVSPHCTPRLRTVDVGNRPDPEAEFARLLREEAETPLDTREAPLLRWCLIRLADRHHRLIHVEHHLVHDGHSWAILLRDLFAAYRARVLGKPLDLLPVRSYEEHARGAAHQRAQPGAREAGVAFWRRELAGAELDLPLPGLARPEARRRHVGGQVRQTLGPDLAERLRAHCRALGLTPFSALLSLFTEVLRQYSGRRDVVVGTAVGNRPEGFENTVGMFVNTIPLRLRADPTAPAVEVLEETTDVLVRALPHQEVPVQELTHELGLHTGGTDNPLFDVMFSAHDAHLPDIEVPDLEVSVFEGFNTGTTRLDIDVVLIPDDRRWIGPRTGRGGMILVWDYDRELYAEETIRLLGDRLRDLLDAYLDTPGAPLGTLALAPTAATSDGPLAQALSTTAADRLLEGLAAGVPDASERTAVLTGAQPLTYDDLDRRATHLARRLRTAGVTPGQPVACVLPRSVDAVVALLACLRSGAVFCPLSPGDPPSRLRVLMERLAPALVLAGRSALPSLPADGPPVAVLEETGDPAAAPAEAVEGAAYVLHTSGSTGLPKPVVVDRSALAHQVRAIAERYALTSSDRVLGFAQPSFDVFLEETLPTLLAGACLVVPRVEVPAPSELAALLAARRVNVVNLPTSYLVAGSAELCEAAASGLWSPRLIVLGGERLAAGLLDPLLETTDATVLNAYGVTEATITSTVHEVARGGQVAGRDVPLGRELPGTRVHVLDPELRPLPEKAVGELAVSGAGLARGYLRDGRTTAERFPQALGGERVYLTGDLGFRDGQGVLHFLGRRDNQVKLRGHRIELEEVEAAASAELGGLPCAVVLDADGPGDPALVGFVASPDEPDRRLLHAALAARLPTALVPARWLRLDALPVLGGGKPDRKALAQTARAAEHRPPQQEAHASPSPGAPRRLVALVREGWQEVLDHEHFTDSSNFFEVGGHSLLAARLAAWLEPRLGVRPPMRLLLGRPVLADQAAGLGEMSA
ncbi:non-ribosomal peptide synthetase [Streptomyces flaveolus]|uniref:non-ribosomal peptide synthetase n=1 Tax=Streptomyces flaveolus TaxID=67297 RepID=UPI0033D3C92C